MLDTTFDESVSLKLLLEWTRRNTPKLYFYGILCNFYGNDGKSLILQTTDDRTQLKMIIWELVLKQSLWIFFKIFTESLNLGQFFYRASTYCIHVAMKHESLIILNCLNGLKNVYIFWNLTELTNCHKHIGFNQYLTIGQHLKWLFSVLQSHGNEYSIMPTYVRERQQSPFEQYLDCRAGAEVINIPGARFPSASVLLCVLAYCTDGKWYYR